MRFFQNGCYKPELPENTDFDHKWSPVILLSQQPKQRSKHAVCLNGRKLYMYGGHGKHGTLNEFWSFDLDKEMWEEVLPSGVCPGKLEGHSMITYSDNIYVFGGEISLASCDETPLWSFDITDKKWRKITTEDNVLWPVTRRGHSAVLYENAMYIYGGFQDLYGPTSELWVYDFNSDSWHFDQHASNTSDNSPSGRYNHSAICHIDKMWVCGGLTGLQPNAELWFWHFKDRHWTNIRVRGGPMELSGHTTACVGWNMYVYGGVTRNGLTNTDMWRFSMWRQTWKKCISTSDFKPEMVTGHAMISFIEFNTKSKAERTQSLPTLKSRKVRDTRITNSAIFGRKSDNSIHPDKIPDKLFYSRPISPPKLQANNNEEEHLIKNDKFRNELCCYDQPLNIIDLEDEVHNKALNTKKQSQSITEYNKNNDSLQSIVKEDLDKKYNVLKLQLTEYTNNIKSKSAISSFKSQQNGLGGQNKQGIVLKHNFKNFSYNLTNDNFPLSQRPRKEKYIEETSFIVPPVMPPYRKGVIVESNNKTVDQLCAEDFNEKCETEKPTLINPIKVTENQCIDNLDFEFSLLIIGGKTDTSLSSLEIERPVKLWKCQNCKCDN